MTHWLYELDRILRGEATRPAALREGSISTPVGGLTVVLILLGLFYGLCLGSFALCNHEQPEFRQLLAAMLKVPALFFLTLLVTVPSLYVFNALVGSRLAFLSMIRLLVAAMGVTLAVLASFGPIVAFFSVTTPSYHFISLLNVLVFALSGVLGLTFLLRTLHRLSEAGKQAVVDVVVADDAPPDAPADAGALQRVHDSAPAAPVQAVFGCWVVVFAVVGGQMAWVLRPFVGDPSMPFTWFRERQSNFFEAIWRIVINLFS